MTGGPVSVAILGKSGEALSEELRRHGLAMSASEARKLTGLLGRDPTRPEAFLFDVAWSEHCSYKSSRQVLAQHFGSRPLPGHVVLGPGEDAGVVEFATHRGERWCVVMSHESHNHPSQVLPVEGAATGVGGIVRDVYCMGAEVVGVLDALRFGDPRGERQAAIARGVIEGIWRYGNALGVPNLGGDVYFDRRFDDNCLVNVVAIGVVPASGVIRSRVPRAAAKEPYVAILVGKPTDASGFGGASFASADLSEEDAAKNLGAVQVADPFLKRVLVEANREVVKLLAREKVEVGWKDLGAGGIGGATVELAAAGNMGVEIDLDAVRCGVKGLPPEVILVAETQERFVWAVPERLADQVVAIYDEAFEMPALHPGAGAITLGRFTDDGLVHLRHGGVGVGTVKAADLTEGIAYERKSEAPRPPSFPTTLETASPDLAGCLEVFTEILAHPDGASRAYVFRHYDPEVGGRTVLRPGEADASVIAPIPGCPAGLAVAVEGNPHRGLADPYQAGAWAVAGAVRNVACVGARPIALSDCLNFGNPEAPEVFHGFKDAVRGIAETADALGLVDDPSVGLPVVTGNVSFYNQSVRGQAIPPSPIVGCVGAVDDVHRVVDATFKTPGRKVVWAGRLDERLGGSLYARVRGIESTYPELDTRTERALIQGLHQVITGGLVSAAHDVSEGGLLTAVFEMCAPFGESARCGVTLDLGPLPGRDRADVALYSEAGAVLVEVDPVHVDDVIAAFEGHGARACVIGEVIAARTLSVSAGDGDAATLDLERACTIHEGGLERWLA